ncbi:MAG: EthD family reductase [Pseudomonadota bacterium]
MLRRTLLAAPAVLFVAAGARAAEPGFKASYLVKRRSDFSFEAFEAYQLETHVPLVLALPGLRRYELEFFRPADGKDQPFDAAAHTWFDDKAANDAAFQTEPAGKALADLPNFLDTEAMVVLVGDMALAERF